MLARGSLNDMSPPPVTSPYNLEITSPLTRVDASVLPEPSSEAVTSRRNAVFAWFYNVGTLCSCLSFVVALAVVIGVMYSHDKWGPWAFVAGSIIYGFAALFAGQQFVSRLARMPHFASFEKAGTTAPSAQASAPLAASSETTLSHSRQASIASDVPGIGIDASGGGEDEAFASSEGACCGCDKLTAVPFVLLLAFITRLVWFILQAGKGKGACRAGALLPSAADQNFFRMDTCAVGNEERTKDPCCSAYVDQNSGSSNSHSGLTTIFSRLGNMLLFSGFSAIGFYFARVSSDAVKAQAGGDDAIYQTDQSAGSDNKQCSVRLCSYGATCARGLAVLLNFWVWAFEIGVTGMRLWANSPVPRDPS